MEMKRLSYLLVAMFVIGSTSPAICQMNTGNYSIEVRNRDGSGLFRGRLAVRGNNCNLWLSGIQGLTYHLTISERDSDAVKGKWHTTGRRPTETKGDFQFETEDGWLTFKGFLQPHVQIPTGGFGLVPGYECKGSRLRD